MNITGIKIGKLKLKNPVISASGTFGYAKEFEKLVNLKNLGALITKTITIKPRPGNPMPRICETASGMLNAIGLQNEGMDNFINEKLPYLLKLNIPIMVSIAGKDIDEFCCLARILDGIKGVDAIELNISCPNIRGEGKSSEVRGLIAQDKKTTYKTVNSIRKVTSKTLITKLSPNVTDIVEIAKASEDGGTDAVSLVNTFLGMAIDIDTRKPVLANITGGLSGPCIKPLAIRMVWEVSKNINIPVIGIGGIMNARDAIEFLIAGSSAVQVGTANFIEPDVCEKVIKGIRAYLEKNKIKNIKELIGSLRTKLW